LPRRSICGQDCFHTKSGNGFREQLAKLRIAIPYQEPGWFLVREGISQLLSGGPCQ